jgi:DNA-directed RNA polymerase beta' subunit
MVFRYRSEVFHSLDRTFKAKSVQLFLAGPHMIKKWAQETSDGNTLPLQEYRSGQVLTFLTYDYKSFQPYQSGLFCETLFGPIDSPSRRQKLAYFQLPCPLMHIWYLKGTISHICRLINRKRKFVQRMVYSRYFTCTRGNGFNHEEINSKNIRGLVPSGSRSSEIDLKSLAFLKVEHQTHVQYYFNRLKPRDSEISSLDNLPWQTRLDVNNSLIPGLSIFQYWVQHHRFDLENNIRKKAGQQMPSKTWPRFKKLAFIHSQLDSVCQANLALTPVPIQPYTFIPAVQPSSSQKWVTRPPENQNKMSKLDRHPFIMVHTDMLTFFVHPTNTSATLNQGQKIPENLLCLFWAQPAVQKHLKSWLYDNHDLGQILPQPKPNLGSPVQIEHLNILNKREIPMTQYALFKNTLNRQVQYIYQPRVNLYMKKHFDVETRTYSRANHVDNVLDLFYDAMGQRSRQARKLSQRIHMQAETQPTNKHNLKRKKQPTYDDFIFGFDGLNRDLQYRATTWSSYKEILYMPYRNNIIVDAFKFSLDDANHLYPTRLSLHYDRKQSLLKIWQSYMRQFRYLKMLWKPTWEHRQGQYDSPKIYFKQTYHEWPLTLNHLYDLSENFNLYPRIKNMKRGLRWKNDFVEGLRSFEQNACVNPYKVLDLVHGLNSDFQLCSQGNPFSPVNPLHVGLPSRFLSKPKRAHADPLSCPQVRRSLQVKFQTCLQKSVWLCLLKQTGKAMAEQQLRLRLQAFVPQAEPAQEIQAWLNYEKTKIIYFFVQRFHPYCSFAPFGLASSVSTKKEINPSGSASTQRQDQNNSLLTRFRWWFILEKNMKAFLSSKTPLTYSSLLKWGLQMHRPLMFHPFVSSNIKMEVMIHKLVSEWVLVRHTKEAWIMNPLNTCSSRSKPVEANAFSKRRNLFLTKQRLYLTPGKRKRYAKPNKALFKAQLLTWLYFSLPWLWLKTKHERWRLSLWWLTLHKPYAPWKYRTSSLMSLPGWFTFSDIVLLPKLEFDLTYQDVYIDRYVPFEACDVTFTYPQRQTPTQLDTLRTEMFLDFYFPFFQRQPRFIRNKFCVWPQLTIYETDLPAGLFDLLMLICGHKIEDRVLGPYVDRGFSFETDSTGSRPLSLYLGQLKDPTLGYDSQSVSPARGGPYLRYTLEMEAHVLFLNKRIRKRRKVLDLKNTYDCVEENRNNIPAVAYAERKAFKKRVGRIYNGRVLKMAHDNRDDYTSPFPSDKELKERQKKGSQIVPKDGYRTLESRARWLVTKEAPIRYRSPKPMFYWDLDETSPENELTRSVLYYKWVKTLDEKGLREAFGPRAKTKNLKRNRTSRLLSLKKKTPPDLAYALYGVEDIRDILHIYDPEQEKPFKNSLGIKNWFVSPAKTKFGWKHNKVGSDKFNPFVQEFFGSEADAILSSLITQKRQGEMHHRKFLCFVFVLLREFWDTRMIRRWNAKRKISRRKGDRPAKLVYRRRRAQRRNSKDMRVRLILFRKLRLIRPFSRGNIEPSWMLIERIPILPPDLRPIMLLQGQKPITSDLNKLYINVIRRGLELRHKFLLEEIEGGGDEPYDAHAYDVNPLDRSSLEYFENQPLADIHHEPDFPDHAEDYLWYFNSRGLNYPHYTKAVHHQGDPDLRFKHTLLQNAVDSLIQNGKGAPPEVVSSSNPRAFKSLSDILKGKKGRFRQNLLGKRVDYSGRSVIVVGPELQLHQCGLPREMALVLFQPFVIRALLQNQLARDFYHAKRLIRWHQPVVYKTLMTILEQRPILLNRAPTLHRLGIQAFQAKLVAGRAILLHPLVCSAFNADFDGDQMAVHLPLSREACAEAWTLMWSRNNLLSAATNDPVPVPSQDMVLGCYYLTSWDHIRRFDLLNQTLIQDPVLGSLTTSSPKTNLGLSIPIVNLEHQTGSARHFLPHAYQRAEEKQFDSKTWRQLDPVQNLYHHGQIQHHTIFWLQWKTFETQCRNQPTWEFQMDSFGRCMHYHSDFKTFCVGHSETHYIKTTLGRALMNRNLKDILHQ